MDKGFVIHEVGTAVVYINHTNFSLQRLNVIKSEWPNMPYHFWIQVLGGKLVRVSETSMGWLPNYEASLRPALHQE